MTPPTRPPSPLFLHSHYLPFTPSRETCSPLLPPSPLFFLPFPLPSEFLARETSSRRVHLPSSAVNYGLTTWIIENPDRVLSFFFFSPPSLRLKFDMEKEGEEEGKGQRKFGGSLTFSIERTWRMTTERGGLIFKRWKFSMQSSWTFLRPSFFLWWNIYI